MGEAVAMIILLGIFLVMFILGDMHAKAAAKDAQDEEDSTKLEKLNEALGRTGSEVTEADPGVHRP